MKTICIDFDGVIHDYSRGWQGVDVFDRPVNGAKEGTAALKEKGWTIIIYTTRNDTPALRSWLEKNDISYDYINVNPNQPEGSDKGKLIANVYLDDRGILFKGNWKKAILEILSFTPWQKPGNSSADGNEIKDESDSYMDRMLIERDEVKERYLNGRKFMFSDKFNTLTDKDKSLLEAQLNAMERYLMILSERIGIAQEREKAERMKAECASR